MADLPGSPAPSGAPGSAQESADVPTAQEWLDRIRSGDRNALGRAITLVESTRPEDRRLTLDLIDACVPLSASGQSIRIGVSGLPGAGKSTLIDRLGCRIVDEGHRVAVLTIDPTSERSGGSILGDKIRMEALARHEAAFIRPSPSRGSPGGVGPGTREAILLCEAAGYDVVIVETMGVGQSEMDVSRLVDFLVLMVTAGGGDELQGIKRGVVEFAHAVVVSKVDGDNAGRALETAELYRNVVQLFPGDESGWSTEVFAVSSIEDVGLDRLWNRAKEYHGTRRVSGYLRSKRRSQAVQWMRAAIDDELERRLLGNARARKLIAQYEELVAEGRASPTGAAIRAVDELLGGR